MFTAMLYRYPSFNTDTIRTFAKMCLYAAILALVFVGTLIVAPLILAAISAACVAVLATATAACLAVGAACVVATNVVAAAVVGLVAFITKAVLISAAVASPMLIVRIQKGFS